MIYKSKFEAEVVKTLLEEKVHEVFCERQDAYGIRSGDIDVMMAVKLDALTDMLAEHVADCIMVEVAYGC